MNGKGNNAEFLKEYQKRFEKKLSENEITVVKYWKERLDKLITMKPDGIGSLQLEMKKRSQMMNTRIDTLKKG